MALPSAAADEAAMDRRVTDLASERADAAHAVEALKAQTRLVNEVGDDRDTIEPTTRLS
jgi:hypothetical protein